MDEKTNKKIKSSRTNNPSKKEKRTTQISVLVVTYNPVKEKLIATLDSIIKQKGIDFDVVVSDDGSKDNLFLDIKKYFKEKRFENYTLINNKINKGTVENSYVGLKACKGEYVKTISPGDLLYGETILKEWLDDMKTKNSKWSFCDAIYYSNEKNQKEYYAVKAHPNQIGPYLNKGFQKCRWNYLVLDDIALGAAILAKNDLMIAYLERIVGKVKYAEDNIWRLMMFDGIVGTYFQKDAILYEYGSGISTSGSEIWQERIKKDYIEATKIMLENEEMDEFQEKTKSYLQKEKNFINKLLTPGKILITIKRKIFPRMTNTPGR